MHDKLIASLISGALTARGATFDATKPAYILLYQSGAVGVYAAAQAVTFHDYMEYSLDEKGKLIQNPRAPKTFFSGSGLNNLFASIFNTNFKIGDVTAEVLATLDGIDPKFIIGVKWYNPKGDPKIVDVNLEDYALSQEQKTQLAVGRAYFSSLNSRQTLKDDSAALIKTTTAFIKDLITTNQRANRNVWTESGMLVLEIQSALEADQKIMSAFTALMQKFANLGLTTAMTLDTVLASALEPLPWTLGKHVDLTVAPFLYLYPRGAGMPKAGPAVPPSDHSVRIKVS